MTPETPQEFIRRRLAEMDITQQRLCEVTGFHQPTVSHWMRGARQPDIESMRILCAVLGPYEIVASRVAIVL